MNRVRRFLEALQVLVGFVWADGGLDFTADERAADEVPEKLRSLPDSNYAETVKGVNAFLCHALGANDTNGLALALVGLLAEQDFDRRFRIHHQAQEDSAQLALAVDRADAVLVVDLDVQLG